MPTREEKIKIIRYYCDAQYGFFCGKCIIKEICKNETKHNGHISNWSAKGLNEAWVKIKVLGNIQAIQKIHRDNTDNLKKEIEKGIENGSKTAQDIVNHPQHYESGQFECIDVMIETQGAEAVANFCICNAFKYLYSWKHKNGVEDIKKAKWYIDKFLEIEADRSENSAPRTQTK